MLAPQIDYTSDPNYVIVDGVPILDEHELVVPGNKEKGTEEKRIKITPQVLQFICDNNNRRVQQTGDTVQLVLGHTLDDAPEDSQPEIVGEADSFRVAPLFNTGRMAIHARWKLSKDPAKLAKVKGPTRRSVELWTDRWEIDPIAILKSTPPERDLGVLRLSRMERRTLGSDGKVRYELTRQTLPVSYEATPMQPNPTPSPTMPAAQQQPPTQVTAPGSSPPVDPALLQAVTSAIMQSDVMVRMQQMLENLSQQVQQLANPMPGMQNPNAIPMPGQQPPGMGGMPGQQPGMGGDPMQAMLAQLMGGMGQQPGQDEQQDEQRDDKDKVRMDAGSPGASFNPGFTGGGNTFLPSAQTRDRDPRVPRMNMQQYQHQPAPVLPTPGQQIATTPVPQQPAFPAQEPAEAIIARLQRERDDAIRLARGYQILAELSALDKEGVEFDAQAELPFLLQLDDNNRAIRYQHMRRYHRNRNEVVRPGAQVPGLPGFVGQQPAVPVQYQRSDAAQPGGREADPTPAEHNAVLDMMVEEKQSGREPNYRICLSRIRAGRNGRYEPTY